MNKKMILLLISATFTTMSQRNVHRLHKKTMAHIKVCSSNDSTNYNLIDNNLRPIPLLHVFDKKHFESNLLPKKFIKYDHNQNQITTKKLNKLIEHLFEEIDRKSKSYRHFKILKNSGFVRHKKCGLLVAKFKDYPFILKLFIEPPKSFVNPYDKGFEATNFFIAGGALRHTLGFSRIKTLNYVKKAIAKNERWKNRIIVPRKWFWLPQNPTWLHIKTYNLGKRKKDYVTMPAIYGVIADELIKDSTKTTNYEEIMAFSQFLEHRIDPHTKNFFIEKETGKIALIDTELFPLILGFQERIRPSHSHIKWYTHLAGKYLKEKMFTLKSERIKRQHKTYGYYLA